MAEGSDNIAITYAQERSTNSNSRMELCSIVNVTVEIIRHESRLICLTENNQLNTSTSLSVFDLCEYESPPNFYQILIQYVFGCYREKKIFALLILKFINCTVIVNLFVTRIVT